MIYWSVVNVMSVCSEVYFLPMYSKALGYTGCLELYDFIYVYLKQVY